MPAEEARSKFIGSGACVRKCQGTSEGLEAQPQRVPDLPLASAMRRRGSADARPSLSGHGARLRAVAFPLPGRSGTVAPRLGSRWLLGTVVSLVACPRELRPWPPRCPRITPAPALRQPGPFRFPCRPRGRWPARASCIEEAACSAESARWKSRSLFKSGGTVPVGRRHAASRSWRSMNVRKREAAPWGFVAPGGHWQLPTNVNVTPARGQPRGAAGAAACPRLFPAALAV